MEPTDLVIRLSTPIEGVSASRMRLAEGGYRRMYESVQHWTFMKTVQETKTTNFKCDCLSCASVVMRVPRSGQIRCPFRLYHRMPTSEALGIV